MDYSEFPMNVTVEEDDSITIEWDPDHPATCFFNDWSAEDFSNAIMEEARRVIAEHGE